MLCMFDKHAIWCQCASMVPFTMAVASLFSCQWITLSMDIYWTFVFWCAACIQFVSAEHGPFIVSTPTWQNARLSWNFTVHVIVFVWTMNNWDVLHQLLLLPVYFLIGKYLFKYGYYLTVATVLYQVCFMYTLTPVALVLAIEYIEREQNKKMIQTSMADIYIKRSYLFRAIGICVTSISLWLLRCQHRFPHTLRKTPLFMGIVSLFIAILWCKYNVKKTRVSHNAVIQSFGHGIAASLNAAESCPICRKCLTSLDMESSFGD